MSSIGPQIPAHLLKQIRPVEDDGSDDNEGPQQSTSGSVSKGPVTGPQIPTSRQDISSSSSKLNVYDEDDDDDDGPVVPTNNIGPSMHPEFVKQRERNIQSNKLVAGPSSWLSEPTNPLSKAKSQGKRAIGPSLPTYAPIYDPNTTSLPDDDSDDDDVGPKPLPAGMQHRQVDAVKEFLEREEKRKNLAEEAAKPKPPKRDEWMLVPPTASGLLGSLDPTKLKARQFSRSTAPSNTKSGNDTSLWTETPAERQQRLADEVSGKKRRVTDAPAEDDVDTVKKKRRIREEEEQIRKGVEEHTRKRRGPALVDQHSSSTKKSTESDELPVIWDHSRDMGLGGRLMDDDKRNKMLKEAKGLGSRFGSGTSGFL